jgi:hypothetical protein
MQDPLIQQTMGQNPQAPMIQQAMMAHIAEHLGFAYRNKIQEALGADLPMPDDKLDPAVEVQLSRLVAQAAPMVLQNSQGQVAQQAAAAQAQQNQQDPVIQMQMQELQLKIQELELKKQKLSIDAATQADKLELEREKVSAQFELEGMKLGMKSQFDQAKAASANEIEGVRMGTDIAKTKADMEFRRQEINKPQPKSKGTK